MAAAADWADQKSDALFWMRAICVTHTVRQLIKRFADSAVKQKANSDHSSSLCVLHLQAGSGAHHINWIQRCSIFGRELIDYWSQNSIIIYKGIKWLRAEAHLLSIFSSSSESASERFEKAGRRSVALEFILLNDFSAIPIRL